MSTRINMPGLLAVLFGLFWVAPPASADGPAPAPESDWTRVVRASPYWVSQGVYDNMVTIRRWVLEASGYCSDPDRHILYDVRGRFLGYIDDGPSRADTQQLLNAQRASLAARGQVDHWAAGDADTTGYPFALACDQPHASLPEAVDRYLGVAAGDRVWGRWDDLSFARQEAPEPLHEALLYVYNTRLAQQRIDLPPELPRYLGGQVLIESSGQPRAHSGAGARGILQLSAEALSDCNIRPANYWHRLAQIDCALRLMAQNARNLRPAFHQRFGDLPQAKRDRLFTLLLIQAYHGGAARVAGLLGEGALAEPAAYFARHHERFTAGDIAFGMIFHNLGRDRLGLASLYYVADVQLATEALCRTRQLKASRFCPQPE